MNINFQNENHQENNVINPEKSSENNNNIAVDDFKADIKSYKDPEGLTVRKMRIGLWLVANRKNFRIILIGLLLIVIVCVWSIFVFTFGRHVFFGIKFDQNLFKGVISHNTEFFNIIQANPVKNLVFNNADSVKTGENRHDFYIKITNPNEKYWAHFNYVFAVGGVKTKQASGFILPAETKYVVLLGQDLANASGNLSFEIVQIDWRQIDFHKYKDWKNFAKDRLNINTDNINFVPAQTSSLSEKISINSLDFTATNNTAYNYRDVAFIALLYNNNKIVGVNRYIANSFISGQTRNIGITWPENISRVSTILIIPEIDITRDDIYIKFDGGAGNEK